MDTKLKLSLATMNEVRMRELIDAGRPNIAEMCAYFRKAAGMDRILGYQNAVAGWVRGKNLPSVAAEAAAGMWLQRRLAPLIPAEPSPTLVAIPTPVMLIVACPTAEVAAKVARLVGMFGCETTEV